MQFLKLRKIFGFIFALLLIVSFPVASFVHAETSNVLMFLWRGETSAEEGFKSGLEEEYEGAIEYKVCDVNKEIETLRECFETFNESDFKLIYTYGSPLTFRVAQNYKDAPIVFNIVYDPVGYKIIDNWEEKQPNLTGVSNSIPAEIQIKKIFELFGEGDIGFVYSPWDKESVIFKEEMEACLAGKEQRLLSFKYTNNLRDFRAFLLKNRGNIFCFYIASGGKMTKELKRILSELNRRKLPTCVSSTSYLKQGALLCITTDYSLLGKRAGKYAAQILKGANPADLQIFRPTEAEIELYVNSKTLARINIGLPKDVKINYITQ